MALLLIAGFAALLTFIYSAKIVFGAFFDGPKDMSGVHEAPVSLWLPAALPGRPADPGSDPPVPPTRPPVNRAASGISALPG